VASWNAGSERLKGYSTDEIIGKHFSVFYPPEDVVNGKPEQVLAEATSADKAWTKDGESAKTARGFWANVVLTALRDTKAACMGLRSSPGHERKA